MKLIDLLVKELPKRGGWPDGAEIAWQSAVDGEIYFDSKAKSRVVHHNGIIFLPVVHRNAPGYEKVTRAQYEAALAKSDGWIEWGGGECPVERGCVVDYKVQGCEGVLCGNSHHLRWSHDADWQSGNIIAYRPHRDINSRANDDRLEQDLNECIGRDVDQAWNGEGLPPVGAECEVRCGNSWVGCKVVYRGDAGVAFVYSDNSTIDCVGTGRGDYFRPLRTEAEKALESAKYIIADLCRDSASNGHSADLIMEAIAAGKIPGVKLESK